MYGQFTREELQMALSIRKDAHLLSQYEKSNVRNYTRVPFFISGISKSQEFHNTVGSLCQWSDMHDGIICH